MGAAVHQSRRRQRPPRQEWIFVFIKTHLSHGFAGADDNRTRHAGVGSGGGRSSAISRKISWNNSLGTATSAIWKMTYRACVTILAPILTSFSLGLVSALLDRLRAY